MVSSRFVGTTNERWKRDIKWVNTTKDEIPKVGVYELRHTALCVCVCVRVRAGRVTTQCMGKLGTSAAGYDIAKRVSVILVHRE